MIVSDLDVCFNSFGINVTWRLQEMIKATAILSKNQWIIYSRVEKKLIDAERNFIIKQACAIVDVKISSNRFFSIRILFINRQYIFELNFLCIFCKYRWRFVAKPSSYPRSEMTIYFEQCRKAW